MINYLLILEWIGTIGILTGISFLSSKKASKPKTRIKGLSITIIGCIILGSFAFIIGTYGVMTTQIGVIIISSYRIYNCKKEIIRRRLY